MFTARLFEGAVRPFLQDLLKAKAPTPKTAFGRKQHAVKDVDQAREQLAKLNVEYASLASPFTHRSGNARRVKLFINAFKKVSEDLTEALAASTRMIESADKDSVVPEGGYSRCQEVARRCNSIIFWLIGIADDRPKKRPETDWMCTWNEQDLSGFCEIPGGSPFLRMYWQALNMLREEIWNLWQIMANVNRCA